jgi:hypothetical protein
MPSEGRSLWFEQALLGETWARDVRITVADGLIASIETGAPHGADDAGAGSPCRASPTFTATPSSAPWPA